MAQPLRNVLQIINAVQNEMGLPASTTVFGNSDLTTVQLLSFLQAANEELRESNDDGWSVTEAEFNIVVNVPTITVGTMIANGAIITNIPSTAGLSANYWTVTGSNIPQGARIKSVDSATQITMTMVNTGAAIATPIIFAQDTYALPADLQKYADRTFWDRTNRWELLGPDSPQLDQWHKSGVVATGPRRHFRDVGPFANQFRLWPAPSDIVAPIQIVFVYNSLNTVNVNGLGATFAQAFASDLDQPLINDRALILGVKWRFWEQKGMNWVSKRDEYDKYVERIIARDDPAPTLSIIPRVSPLLISPSNVQDGYFPGS